MKIVRLKRINLLYFIPLFIILTVLSISALFANSKINDVIETVAVDFEIAQKNDTENTSKTIKVYFHEKDEVAEIPLEEYLLGVVPAEMPPVFEAEALKAQAIAARTFILNRERGNNEESLKVHKGAAICTNPNHCKAYVSEEKAREKWGNDWNDKFKQKIIDVVKETHGLIITYNDEPISAVFHSTSSGRTENSEDVWGNQLPYLRSVVSEGEEKSPRYTSKEEFSYEQFKENLLKLNPNADFSGNANDWIKNITFNESGSVKEINICGHNYKGTDIRTAFSLRSTNFKIEFKDNVIFNVTGNGHGVGMSQYGANYAAQNGSNYKQILSKYYLGTEIKKIY